MGSCHLVMEGLTTHRAETRSEYCFPPLALFFFSSIARLNEGNRPLIYILVQASHPAVDW